jgi:phage/plasmid primase-like uncharacterized protein
LIVSDAAERQQILQRQMLGATETPREAEVIRTIADNLSRFSNRRLATEMRRRDPMESATAAQPASAAQREGARQHQDATADKPKTPAIGHTRRLRGPDQPRSEPRSARPVAARSKAPRPTRRREHADVVGAFADALRRAGFQLRGAPVMDGKWHRARVEGDKGATKSGRYRGFTDGLPSGFIQNFKRGDGIRWHAERPATPMTDAEREQLARRKAARQSEQEAALQAATARAQTRWKAGLPVRDHPYLKAKGIASDETFRRDRRGNLMTALRDSTGLIRNIQTITPDGQKRFIPGGQVTGLFSLVGEIKPNKPVLIVKGVAAARTLFDATGMPVVVAYNAGNLGAVSKVIAAIAPGSRQVFAADNDWHLPRQEPPQRNVGREKAEAAAEKVGGIVLLPRFGAIETSPLNKDATLPTDWNDFAALFGKEKLKATIETSLHAEGITMAQQSRQEAAERASKQASKGPLTQAERDAARQRTTANAQDAARQQAQQQQQEHLRHQQDRGLSQ